MVTELAMGAQAAGQEEDLGVEGPGAHVTIEVGQVGVLADRLIERLPVEATREKLNQGRFANSDVASDGDEMLHDLPLPCGRGRPPQLYRSRRYTWLVLRTLLPEPEPGYPGWAGSHAGRPPVRGSCGWNGGMPRVSRIRLTM